MKIFRSKETMFIMWDFFKLSALPITILIGIINAAKEFLKNATLGTMITVIISCSFLAIYLTVFGFLISWKIRRNIKDRKDKQDDRTDQIAFRAEQRQNRQNDAAGRADVFEAAKNIKKTQFSKYFENIEKILKEKERTSEILDGLDTLNKSVNDNTEVVRDSTSETKMANREKSVSEPNGKSPRPFSFITKFWIQRL